MAKVTLLTVPLTLVHSTNKDALIAYAVKTISNPEDRIPLYLEWAYVNSVNLEPPDIELLVQLSAKDLQLQS